MQVSPDLLIYKHKKSNPQICYSNKDNMCINNLVHFININKYELTPVFFQ